MYGGLKFSYSNRRLKYFFYRSSGSLHKLFMYFLCELFHKIFIQILVFNFSDIFNSVLNKIGINIFLKLHFLREVFH